MRIRLCYAVLPWTASVAALTAISFCLTWCTFWGKYEGKVLNKILNTSPCKRLPQQQLLLRPRQPWDQGFASRPKGPYWIVNTVVLWWSWSDLHHYSSWQQKYHISLTAFLFLRTLRFALHGHAADVGGEEQLVDAEMLRNTGPQRHPCNVLCQQQYQQNPRWEWGDAEVGVWWDACPTDQVQWVYLSSGGGGG